MSLNVNISLLSSTGNKIDTELDTTSFSHLGVILTDTDTVKDLLNDYIDAYYHDLDNESLSIVEDEAITIFNQIQKGKQPVIYETEMTKLPRLVDMKFSTSDLINDKIFLTVKISYKDREMTKYFLDRVVRGLAFGE